MDNLLKKIPGSPATKALGTALLLSVALAYPVFGSKEGRQGHDYFSSDRPEAVRSGEEQLRRLARQEREQNRSTK